MTINVKRNCGCNNADADQNVNQINPYMSNPCHVEMILTEGAEVVQKSAEVVHREEGRLNSRQRGSRVRRAIAAA